MEEIRLIDIKEDILADNSKDTSIVRQRLREKNIVMINIMSSPGSGKTSLIIRSVRELKKEYRFAVVEADIESVVDAVKVSQEQIPAVQLRTGGACHIDARMVDLSLNELPLDDLDIIILENVGNLVCPAEFDTGSAKNVMILSIPEGDDKPLKYPLMFSICDALVVNKIDYLPLSDFDLNAMKERVFRLNPNIKIFEVSCRTGNGLSEWISWLQSEIKNYRTAKI